MNLQLEDSWKKGIKLIGSLFIIYIGFRFVLPLIYPFVIASGFAVFIFPGIRRMCDWFGLCSMRKKNWICRIGIAVFYGVVFIVFGWLLIMLIRQGRSLLLNLPFYQARWNAYVKSCCCFLDHQLHKSEGESYLFVHSLSQTGWWNSAREMFSKVSIYSVRLLEHVFSFVFSLVITIFATFFLVQEYDSLCTLAKQSALGRKLCIIIRRCKQTLFAYVKAQVLVLLINSGIYMLAFWLTGQSYYVLFGVLVAFFDALPVLGAGAVLVPYGLYFMMSGHLLYAFEMILTYCMCVSIRQYLEAKLIGKGIGVPPLATIFSMYVGYKLFGILGFVFGPLGFLIVKEMLSDPFVESATK